MDPLTDDEIRRLKDLLRHEGLSKFLPYAELAAAEAKLSAARRLVWRTYRQIFVAAVGGVIAVATFWDSATKTAGAFVRWLSGQ